MGDMSDMFLTVFTPTYNRAGLLRRLYESLVRQTSSDFEWLVVDDGSTDDTEMIIRQIIDEQKISIQYVKRANGGKHAAHNTALDYAKGEWFFCVDSDDFLPEDAIQSIKATADQIVEGDCAIVGYKADLNGTPLCPALKMGQAHKTFSAYPEIKQGGEFSFVLRTDILRENRFPVPHGEKFVTESVLYDKLDLLGYTAIVTNQILTLCEYQPNGLSASLYATLLKNPTGFLIFHMQRIDLASSFKERVGHCIRYHSFKRLVRTREYAYHGKHALLVLLLTPTGLLGAWYYKLRYQNAG